MKKKVVAISIVLTTILFILLIIGSIKWQEELSQKYIHWTGQAEIVMFGDSHTANGKWNSIIDKTPVLRLGWSGYTTDMLVGYIDQSTSFHPKYVFILCGGNDISTEDFSVKNTLENFKQMANILKSKNLTPVFQKLMYQRDNPLFNKTIDSINRGLTDYCLKEHIDLIDMGKKMYDSGGLKESLTEDNLHLNEKGYKIWSEAVNTYLQSKY
jgi:alpha-glucosidase